MKKILLVLVASLALVACGSKPAEEAVQVLSCEVNEMGLEMGFDMTFTGEKITAIDVDMNLPYALMGLTYDIVKLIDEEELKLMMLEELGQETPGEFDLKLTEEAMEMSIKMDVKEFVKMGFIEADEANETVNINEAKADIEANGGVCTIK